MGMVGFKCMVSMWRNGTGLQVLNGNEGGMRERIHGYDVKVARME